MVEVGPAAIVETMGRFLGPEIQINAIAPGPVDGDRLSGKEGKAGLFDRRGKLILENKRLNAVHAATVRAIRRGVRVEAVLTRLARNDIAQMAHDTNNPRELRDLALDAARTGTDDSTWGRFLLTTSMAKRLVARLRLGGYSSDSPLLAGRPDDGWLLRVPPDDVPFLPPAQIQVEARRSAAASCRCSTSARCRPRARSRRPPCSSSPTARSAARRSCRRAALNVERSTTERELFGSPKQERLDQMRGRTVWLIGEHLVDYLAATARAFVEECHVGKVVLVTRTAAGAAAITDSLADLPAA